MQSVDEFLKTPRAGTSFPSAPVCEPNPSETTASPAPAEERAAARRRCRSCPCAPRARARSIPRRRRRGGHVPVSPWAVQVDQAVPCATVGRLLLWWLCQELVGDSSPRGRQGGARGISGGDASRHLQRDDTFTHPQTAKEEPEIRTCGRGLAVTHPSCWGAPKSPNSCFLAGGIGLHPEQQLPGHELRHRDSRGLATL